MDEQSLVEPAPKPGWLLRVLRDQRIAFLLVGGFNTLLSYGVFVVLDRTLGHAVDAIAGRTVGSLVTLIVTYALGIGVAFVLHRNLVFRVRGHVWRDFIRFQSLYWVTLAINAVALPVLVELGVPRILAQLGIVATTTVLSYIGHRYFSFRRSKGEADPVEPEAGPLGPAIGPVPDSDAPPA